MTWWVALNGTWIECHSHLKSQLFRSIIDLRIETVTWAWMYLADDSVDWANIERQTNIWQDFPCGRGEREREREVFWIEERVVWPRHFIHSELCPIDAACWACPKTLQFFCSVWAVDNYWATETCHCMKCDNTAMLRNETATQPRRRFN
jgi:hypothetical protein